MAEESAACGCRVAGPKPHPGDSWPVLWLLALAARRSRKVQKVEEVEEDGRSQ
jgi:hypothetical protein